MSFLIYHDNQQYDLNHITEHHLGKLTLDTFKRHSDKIHQIEIDSDKRETHDSVRLRSIRVAECLLSKKILVGDVIGLCGRNHSDLAIPLIASFYLGASLFPLPENAVIVEMEHYLLLGKPKIVFCDLNQASLIEKCAENLGLQLEIVIFESDPKTNYTNFSDFLKITNTEELFRPVEFDPETTTALLATSSGSTGKPKGICLTHKMLTIVIKASLKDVDEEEMYKGINLNFSGLIWITGTMTILLSCLLGQTRLHSPNGFTPEAFFSIVKKYKPSCAVINEYVVGTILRHPLVNEVDLGSFQFILVLGSLITDSMKEKLEKIAYNADVKNSYGMTECCGPFIVFPHNVFRKGSCGKVLPWMQCKIVDVEDGKELDSNRVGEIYGRSVTFFKGYYNDAELTRSSLTDDGWFKTGDLGYIDEDGFVYIVDRIKELLKYRSHHVMPSELEAYIKKLDGIINVCVVGKSHPIDGQLPMAFVQKTQDSKITAEDIQNIIKENLSDVKQLRGGVVFLDEFPMTQTGKVDRNAIKMLSKENYT